MINYNDKKMWTNLQMIVTLNEWNFESSRKLLNIYFKQQKHHRRVSEPIKRSEHFGGK